VIRNSVLFVAGINIDGPPQGGEHYKNQLIRKFLIDNYNVTVIDTHHWKKRPWVLIRILYFIIYFKGYNIIISLTTTSSLKLIKIISIIRPSLIKRIHYFTIGGNLSESLENLNFSKIVILNLKSVIVEGDTIANKLLQHDIKENVKVLPNFKTKVGIKYNERIRKLKFFYLGTITKSKGIFELMEVFDRVSSLKSEMELHFYGPLDLDQEDKELFQTKLKENLNIQYKGYLKNLNNEIVAYEILSEYCAMVFPSYYPGEGFPGVFLDAFNVGMPVIASDWNMHTEVIKDGFNGKIVETKNNSDLEKAMMWFVENFQTEKYFAMCENARKSFDKYEYPKVLSEYFNDRNS
jgi:glycosyltransferase involved in cell wall biosynthesis